jgi:serine/threonine protein kinase
VRVDRDLTQPADDSDLYAGPPEDPNRYRLGNTVGKGGEGEVVHAFLFTLIGGRTSRSRSGVGPHGGDPDFAGQEGAWREQLELVRFLDHPGIVRMREVFAGTPPHGGDRRNRPGRALYLVMNWVPGEALSTWVVSHPISSFGQIHPILVAIAGALGHMHSGIDTGGTPVVHGDLKPSNVIVGDRVRIVHFGLAHSARRPDHRGKSPGYAAPEIARAGCQHRT